MNKKILSIIRKKNNTKIVSLSAYSKNVAEIIDNHCDIVLVGDSLGSVLYNYKSTREVSLDTMIEHSKSVRLGVKKSLMVVDMPFNTYATKKSALKNAKKIIKETKCDALKLEGGKKIYEIIKNLVKNDIPIMGHLGVLPQSAKNFKRSKITGNCRCFFNGIRMHRKLAGKGYYKTNQNPNHWYRSLK